MSFYTLWAATVSFNLSEINSFHDIPLKLYIFFYEDDYVYFVSVEN